MDGRVLNTAVFGWYNILNHRTNINMVGSASEQLNISAFGVWSVLTACFTFNGQMSACSMLYLCVVLFPACTEPVVAFVV